jgi:hypothetical protein
VRGAVSGIGVVNLFAGLADLAQLFAAREPPEPDQMTLHDGSRQH